MLGVQRVGAGPWRTPPTAPRPSTVLPDASRPPRNDRSVRQSLWHCDIHGCGLCSPHFAGALRLAPHARTPARVRARATRHAKTVNRMGVRGGRGRARACACACAWRIHGDGRVICSDPLTKPRRTITAIRGSMLKCIMGWYAVFSVDLYRRPHRTLWALCLCAYCFLSTRVRARRAVTASTHNPCSCGGVQVEDGL